MPSTSIISLNEFLRQNDTNFDLKSVDYTIKQAIWDQCLDALRQDRNDIMLVEVVACLRILTRDETFRSQFSESIQSKLVFYIDPTRSEMVESGVCLESLKTLSNLIFKQPKTITYLKSIGILPNSMKLMKSCYGDPTKHNLVLIALKIIFLLSGFDSSTRFELADQFNALDLFNNLCNSFDEKHLTVADTNLLLEALKAVFNIVFIVRDREDLKTRFKCDIDRLVTTVRGFLICPLVEGNRTELICRIVHLLTVTPKRCYKFLICPHVTGQTDPSNEATHNPTQFDTDQLVDRTKMQAIDVLLDFLNSQLESYSPDQPPDTNSGSGLRLDEALCPILNVMTRLCQSNRTIRKYCRLKILPHLGKDVTRLPEEGSTLRNRLCKLLTNPLQDVSELAAVLIFVLCKESIGRAVKYTGFGNFAGFLARHALLGQPSKRKTRQTTSLEQPTSNENLSEDEYSTQSSDSDTEEYDRLKDNVNPVTGRWELPKPNPVDEMTDEQKEYLAMELVQKIDKLQRSGLIQPGRVDEDGRVKPVEHVLELLDQTKLPETQASDSDSDR